MKKCINLLIRNNKFPFYKWENRKLEKLSGTILAGDVGGTNARLFQLKISQGILTPVKEESFKTSCFSSIFELFDKFFDEGIRDVQSICLGVAGPVTNGIVQGTNFSWVIDEKAIIKKTGINKVSVINDMEAHAFGLGLVEEKDFFEIKKGSEIPGNSCIISPGTGLGEAGLFWNDGQYIPFATEGGHCDFSPRDETDHALWQFLNKKFGHVSWERIVSGPGILHIYQFLSEYRNAKEPEWFRDKKSQLDPASLISYCALNKLYPLCEEVMELFVKFLAIEAAQISLKLKATGGVYMGGGILPRIKEIITPERFQENFVNSNRLNPLLDLIPVKIILDERTALKGAALVASIRLLK